MEFYYTDERNEQMLIFLLKEYNIKTVVASPGATNSSLVASMQQDSFFKMYSCVDERSAAYMAVGLSEISGEPIVLSCTGATSSRNYMPALTEAYYRKLPIIAVTSSQDIMNIGHLIAQVTDRTKLPNDIAITSVQIQNIRSPKDEWDCNLKLNMALQSFRPVPGPVHINLCTGIGKGNDVKVLPETKVIKKYILGDDFPDISNETRVAIFIGSHTSFKESEIEAINNFCSVYNAVVFCDHTSSYRSKYRVQYALLGAQDNLAKSLSAVDILIHIGEVSGDYDTLQTIAAKKVWRVNADGAFHDTFRKLDKVFCMEEIAFFELYAKGKRKKDDSYLNECKLAYKSLYNRIQDLPFSNIYIAKKIAPILPKNSVLYLGILNSLRSWNFFEVDDSIHTVSNVGGFGIDGIVSSLIGSSFYDSQRLCFGVVGDLSFFYDMNSIGNRHIGKNIRLLIVNNGHGQEFEMYNHGAAFMGADVNEFVAAAGHYGVKSKDLVRHYAEDLGFEYMSASSIGEFDRILGDFTSPNIGEKSIIFEVFTNCEDENNALFLTRNALVDTKYVTKQKVKNIVKSILPDGLLNR